MVVDYDLNRRGTNYGRDNGEDGYTELSGVTTPRGFLRLSKLREVLNHVESSQQEYTALLPGKHPGQRRRRNAIHGRRVRRDEDAGEGVLDSLQGLREAILSRAARVIKSLIMTGARLVPDPRLARHTSYFIRATEGREQWKLYDPSSWQ